MNLECCWKDLTLSWVYTTSLLRLTLYWYYYLRPADLYRKWSKSCNSLKCEVLLFCCAAESWAQLVSASWAVLSFILSFFFSFFLLKLCDWTLNSLVLHIQRLSDGVPPVILTRVQRWKWPGFCYQSNETMREWNLVFRFTLKSIFGGGWGGAERPSFKTSPLKSQVLYKHKWMFVFISVTNEFCIKPV